MLKEFKMVPLSSSELIGLITQVLDDKKAVDVVTIALTDRGAIVDYMIVASATSGRQVAALGDAIGHALKQKGLSMSVEGMTQSDWVLVDAGDVLVHIFKPDIPLFYNLEKMWAGGHTAASHLVVA